MSEEEKKAIEKVKRIIERYEHKPIGKISVEFDEFDYNLFKTLLNLIEKQKKEIEELKNTETYKIAIIDKDKYVSKDKIREIIEGDYTNLWKILEIEKMLEE